MEDKHDYNDNELIFHPDLGHLVRRQRKQPNLRNGNLLVGFRFVPTDVELIYYLQTKVGNWPMPLDTQKIIREVELSNFSPQQLTEMHKQQLDKDQKEWYFFTPRERKYPGGERPSRSAGDGYWKPTGKETMIEDNGAEVGSKKVLDFFHGKQPRGTKTNWKMHEYVLKDDNKFDPTTSQNRMELNKWVLCKIYEIKREKKKKNVDEAGAEDDNKNTQNHHGLGQGLCDNAKKNNQNPKRQDFGIAIKNSNIQIEASPCNSSLDDQSSYQLQLEGFHGHGQEMMRNICPPVGVPLMGYWPDPINNSEWDLPNYEEAAAGDCSSSMHNNNNNNNNNRDIVFESFNLEDGLQYGLVGYPYNNNNNNNIQQGGAAASSFDDHQLLLLLGGGGSNLAADDPNNNCCRYLNNQQPPLIDPHDLQQFGHNQQQQQQQGASFDDPQHQFGVGGGGGGGDGGGGGGDASSHQFGNSSGSNTIHKSTT